MTAINTVSLCNAVNCRMQNEAIGAQYLPGVWLIYIKTYAERSKLLKCGNIHNSVLWQLCIMVTLC